MNLSILELGRPLSHFIRGNQAVERTEDQSTQPGWEVTDLLPGSQPDSETWNVTLESEEQQTHWVEHS
jgi:hypothetical protein